MRQVMAVFQGTDGNDTLVGDAGGREQAVALDKIKISTDVQAHVHFDGSGAGFHNTVGMYTYDNTGKITSTQILFADVSSGGVQGGATDFSTALKAGQHIGFFVAPNAAEKSDIQGMLKDGGSFHLVNTADGAPANVLDGKPMQLAFHSSNDQWTNVHTQYWTDLFTTNTKDNVDGFQHAKVTTDPTTGQLHVAFEDLLGGGDHNFHDANFTVDIGTVNAVMMAHDTKGSHGAHDYNDTLYGGAGDDTLIGLSGNDKIYSGTGNDKLFGGTGDDVFFLDSGGTTGAPIFSHASIVGGSGFDTVDFSNAAASVSVDLERHFDLTGFRHDSIWGVEGIKGSANNDSLTGDKTANVIDGGAGNDYIRGGKGADVLTGGSGDDYFYWKKSDVGTGVDYIKDFGNGKDLLNLHDVLKGSKGSFTDNVKLVDDVTGSHLWAKVGGSFQEVAVLEGVHHTSASDLLKAGLLLV